MRFSIETVPERLTVEKSLAVLSNHAPLIQVSRNLDLEKGHRCVIPCKNGDYSLPPSHLTPPPPPLPLPAKFTRVL